MVGNKSFCFILLLVVHKQNGRCRTKTNETKRNKRKKTKPNKKKTMKNIQFVLPFRKSLQIRITLDRTR